MIEICTNLYIGSAEDYENLVQLAGDWLIIHACKEPYHRQALRYETRSAPKDHPEYLYAERANCLCLNLIDAPAKEYIPKKIIDAAIAYAHRGLSDRKVLIHCNQGKSRAPSIGLLYLVKYTDLLPMGYVKAVKRFKEIYPAFEPGIGMRDFVIFHWQDYAYT
jgi:protein-tyrosine phosphatase